MSSLSNIQVAENSLEIYDLDFGRKLLHEYSGIAEDLIDSHIEKIKDKALEERPYPCIKRYRFLDLVMMTTDVYPEVVERIKQGEKFLDLGCCLGQEIRQLVFDGAPSVNTYGSDLYDGFFSLGYELFRDKDRLQTTFMAADIFDNSSQLMQLAEQMNVIFVGNLFHLFKLEEQKKVALRVVQLLIPRPGSLIIGRQLGSDNPGEYSRSGDPSGHMHFRHSPQSWKEIWDHVGEKTGSVWSVEANLVPTFKFASSVADGSLGEIKKLGKSEGLMFTIKRL